MLVISINDFLNFVIYTISLVGALVGNVFLFFRVKKLDFVEAFFRTEFLMGLWMIGKLFMIISKEHESLVMWANIEYFGICFFPVEFLLFGYVYRNNRSLKKKIYLGLLAISTFNFLMFFTNEYHHMFYKVLRISQSIKGPFFYVHMIFSYVALALGIYYIVRKEISGKANIRNISILLVGVLTPLMFNMFYVFDMNENAFDYTPVMYNLAMLFFAFVVFRKNYSNMQQMTRHTILENLAEGVLIIDHEARIIEYNKKMEELVNPYIHLIKYIKIEAIFAKCRIFIKNHGHIQKTYETFRHSPMIHTRVEMVLKMNNKEVHYILSMQKMHGQRGEHTGDIIKIIDVDEYYALMETSNKKNEELRQINEALSESISVKKRLAIEKERNRISKELHDILGHSITLVISILELVKRTYSSDPKRSREKINQAMEATRRGLNELKTSLLEHDIAMLPTQELIDDLRLLVNQVSLSGVKIDFIVSEGISRIKSNYYDTIYRICQESMTNAMRHGKAKNIMMAVRFSLDTVDIIVIDDGLGCKDFKKGNGLKGMEQRVIELGGFFSCGSPDEGGFNLHTQIPLYHEKNNLNQKEPMESVDIFDKD